MLTKIFEDPDKTLTMTLLKISMSLIVGCGMAYGGWIYTTISEGANRTTALEKAVISMSDKLDRANEKLDLALKDIEYHHKGLIK